MEPKPFVKWIGGKARMINDILPLIHDFDGNYYEPFVGGGALFIYLLNSGKLKKQKIFINDINENLINVYRVIKEDLPSLLKELEKKRYKTINKTTYNTLRDRYNDIKDDNTNFYVEKASLFIYLNKTGFNGMYRENKEGKFNIPFGKMNNPNIYDESNFVKLSKLFNDYEVEFSSENCFNFIESRIDYIKSNDFIYFDPPYYNSFSSYHKEIFNKESHLKLNILFKRLKSTVLLSNSNEEFIKELYKDHSFYYRDIKYSVSGNKSSRSITSKEILILKK